MPDQHGRTAVVTGANSGIGYYTALELARHGAHVILACRDLGRGKDAADRISREAPGASLSVEKLDLADLSSIRAFAEWYQREHDGLDLLINNAGVMALPYRKTVDGFEMQFGVNHLGHFALTGLLLPALLRPGARVVTVASFMHYITRPDLSDLNSERKYRRWKAYSRSKSANILFTHEFARRTRAAGVDLVPVAAHPGYAATNLTTSAPKMEGRRLMEIAMTLNDRIVAQPGHQGAWPILYAATMPGVRPDDYFGPKTMFRGSPVRCRRGPWTRDDRTGELLWSASEQLTGVTYDALKR